MRAPGPLSPSANVAAEQRLLTEQRERGRAHRASRVMPAPGRSRSPCEAVPGKTRAKQRPSTGHETPRRQGRDPAAIAGLTKLRPFMCRISLGIVKGQALNQHRVHEGEDRGMRPMPSPSASTATSVNHLSFNSIRTAKRRSLVSIRAYTRHGSLTGLFLGRCVINSKPPSHVIRAENCHIECPGRCYPRS